MCSDPFKQIVSTVFRLVFLQERPFDLAAALLALKTALIVASGVNFSGRLGQNLPVGDRIV